MVLPTNDDIKDANTKLVGFLMYCTLGIAIDNGERSPEIQSNFHPSNLAAMLHTNMLYKPLNSFFC